MFFNKRTVTSFQTLTLTLSGMRGAEEYEIICRGAESEISRYTRIYSGGSDERRLEKRVTQPTSDLLTLFNDCGMMGWNGFHGRNPKGVLDGWMFRFTAEVNDGEVIRADGSNNFPRHFHEFRTAVSEMLYDSNNENQKE